MGGIAGPDPQGLWKSTARLRRTDTGPADTNPDLTAAPAMAVNDSRVDMKARLDQEEGPSRRETRQDLREQPLLVRHFVRHPEGQGEIHAIRGEIEPVGPGEMQAYPLRQARLFHPHPDPFEHSIPGCPSQ